MSDQTIRERTPTSWPRCEAGRNRAEARPECEERARTDVAVDDTERGHGEDRQASAGRIRVRSRPVAPGPRQRGQVPLIVAGGDSGRATCLPHESGARSGYHSGRSQ